MPEAAPASALPPPPAPLYVDEHLLAFDKPAGLLAVPGRGPDKADCLSARVQALWPEALIVHRLDQATSGLMLMARHRLAQRLLGDAFASRAVRKSYQALVCGHPAAVHAACLPAAAAPQAEEDENEEKNGAAPPPPWAAIALPLRPDWPNRPRSVVDASGGKPSLTLWRPLPGAPRLPPAWPQPPAVGRVALRPITGRSHQLRLHMQAVGLPIWGDALYAPHAWPAPRLMLHAHRLHLRHPISGQPLHLRTPALPF